jgi:hypothetical protein
MQQDSSSDPTVTVPARPRWLFRGRPGAWDALVAALTEDPSHPARWPIAPSGPAIVVGDAILLWRSGRGGGIAALCTVVEEPEAVLRPGVAPEVVVGVRIDRALSVPIAPATLVRDPVLRPLAFMDLLDESERRVTPGAGGGARSAAGARDRPDASSDPDGVASEAQHRRAGSGPSASRSSRSSWSRSERMSPAPAPSHPVRRAVAGATPSEQVRPSARRTIRPTCSSTRRRRSRAHTVMLPSRSMMSPRCGGPVSGRLAHASIG